MHESMLARRLVGRDRLWEPDHRTDVAGDALSGYFIAFPHQVLPFDLAAVAAYADVVGGREADTRPRLAD